MTLRESLNERVKEAQAWFSIQLCGYTKREKYCADLDRMCREFLSLPVTLVSVYSHNLFIASGNLTLKTRIQWSDHGCTPYGRYTLFEDLRDEADFGTKNHLHTASMGLFDNGRVLATFTDVRPSYQAMKAIGEISAKLGNPSLSEFRCAEYLQETFDVELAFAEIARRKACEN